MTLEQLLEVIEKAYIDIYLNYKSNYRGCIVKTLSGITFNFDVDNVNEVKQYLVKSIAPEINVDGDTVLTVILEE